MATALAPVGAVAAEAAQHAAAVRQQVMDRYVVQVFGSMPPMEITNLTVTRQPDYAPIFVEEQYAPVMMMPQQTVVELEGRIMRQDMMTQDPGARARRWLREATGVTEVTTTQDYNGDTRINVVAHPGVPAGQVYMVNDAMMENFRMPAMNMGDLVINDHDGAVYAYDGRGWRVGVDPAAPNPAVRNLPPMEPVMVTGAAYYADYMDASYGAKQSEARERAQKLFLETLSTKNREIYQKEKSVYVTGSRGNRFKIICQGQSGNVHWLGEDGETLGQLCAHPWESRGDGRIGSLLPDPDAWTAQLLSIKHDEEAWVRTAHTLGGRKPVYA